MVDDGEPLNGSRVDVDARIGWLLRMARMIGGAGASLEAMAAEVGVSTTQLHRIETGAARRGVVVDAYERALGMPVAMLRAPIDATARTFPYSARDADPGAPVLDVRSMSDLTTAVCDEKPTGGDWLAWARALGQDGAVGLPVPTATDLIRRLVGELCRSVGHAYPSRYEALALLRCGAYGDLVLDVARDWVADPHVQVVADLMSAVGELPEEEAGRWCLDLLDADADLVVAGGAIALEAMGDASDDLGFWTCLAPLLLERLERAVPGTEAHKALSHLVRVVPREAWAAVGARPAVPLTPLPDIPVWDRTDDNRHWAVCERHARDMCAALDIPDQPMLTRLLFDIAIGPLESRAVTSYMLLGAIPGMPEVLAVHLTAIAGDDPDPLIRERAGRRFAGCLQGAPTVPGTGWLTSPDPRRRRWAYRLAGCAGEPLDLDLIRAGLPGDGAYAAGMAGHPQLDELLADPSLDDAARGALRWWAELGPRITD